MVERSKFQFRMRDLLWAVSLIGISFGIWLAFRRIPRLGLLALFGSPSCFFAGLGCIFGKPMWGAVIGFLLAILAAVAIIVINYHFYGLGP